MKLKKIIIFFFIVLIPVYSNGADKTPITPEYPDSSGVLPNENIEMTKVISGSVKKDVEINLRNCIKIALGNNPEINSAFQQILASDSKIKQAWSAFFPTFGWQTSYTHIKQLQLSDAFGRNLQFDYYLSGQITVQQLIYDFGITQNQATVKRLETEISKKEFYSKVNDVIYRTKVAYFDYLLSIEKLKVAQEAIEKYQIFYKQAKSYYFVGSKPKIDVTIAQTNLSDSKLNYITSNSKLMQSIATLNNVMGVPYIDEYSTKEELIYKPVNIEFNDVIKIASESRPELRIAQLKIEKAHQNVNLVKKNILPSLAFQAQYQRGGKSWNSNDGYNIGGYLIFNQVNGMLLRNQVKEAKYLYDKELSNSKKIQNDIYLEVQTAYLKLIEAKNKIPLSSLKVKQAQENYDLSAGRYKFGEAPPTELKDAQTTLYNAKLGYYTSIFEYNKAKASLEKVIGKNLSSPEDYVSLKK